MSKFLTTDFELTRTGRRWLAVAGLLYIGLLILMCFLPQSLYPQLKGIETPGIVRLGRLVFLPLPFNSLIQLGRIPSLGDLLVIVLQNVSNIFLLYPLMLVGSFLFKGWRTVKESVRIGFFISLTIEVTQLCLDFLFDFNRVFETDDLITNTLGAYLAFLTYQGLRLSYLRRRRMNKGSR